MASLTSDQCPSILAMVTPTPYPLPQTSVSLCWLWWPQPPIPYLRPVSLYVGYGIPYLIQCPSMLGMVSGPKPPIPYLRPVSLYVGYGIPYLIQCPSMLGMVSGPKPPIPYLRPVTLYVGSTPHPLPQTSVPLCWLNPPSLTSSSVRLWWPQPPIPYLRPVSLYVGSTPHPLPHPVSLYVGYGDPNPPSLTSDQCPSMLAMVTPTPHPLPHPVSLYVGYGGPNPPSLTSDQCPSMLAMVAPTPHPLPQTSVPLCWLWWPQPPIPYLRPVSLYVGYGGPNPPSPTSDQCLSMLAMVAPTPHPLPQTSVPLCWLWWPQPPIPYLRPVSLYVGYGGPNPPSPTSDQCPSMLAMVAPTPHPLPRTSVPLCWLWWPQPPIPYLRPVSLYVGYGGPNPPSPTSDQCPSMLAIWWPQPPIPYLRPVSLYVGYGGPNPPSPTSDQCPSMLAMVAPTPHPLPQTSVPLCWLW